MLGEKYQKVFTALPEYFTLTDYDIRIISSTDVIRDIEQIKAIIPEFIKSNSLDPSIIFEAMTAKSLTELKFKVQKALSKQKKENNQLQQVMQQNQQLQQELQQLQKQLQEAQSKLESFNEAKIKLEQEKLKNTTQVEWFKAQTERQFRTSTSENDTKRTEIEQAQLYDGNPYNDKIKDI